MRAVLDHPSPVQAGTASAAPTAVWDRLWRLPTPDAKDDRLLARERRNPRFLRIVQCLESTFGAISGLQTIELGCGRGDLSALLAERGASVTLLDASPTALAQARRRFDRLGLRAEYIQADLLELPQRLLGGSDVALST